tara:strand:- start:150 stop:584 length:435 start_codon:yes stop_codon:yes gene_type:complete
MAQPMRVCDREAIVNKIKREWEQASLNKFNQAFEGSENESWLDDKMKELKTIASKMQELEKDFDGVKEGIINHCKHINNTLSDGGTSLYFDYPYSYNSKWSYELRTSMDYKMLKEIESELTLATIGGDFDVQQLIKDLTDRFVK